MSSDSDDDDEEDKRTKSSQTRDAQALNLYEAIIKVNEEKVVQILRQIPSVVRTSDRDGWNAVHYAVWSIAKASGLVEAPVSATASAEHNVDETVLSAARRILFKHLISTSGASLACSNSSGVTVLHLAAWYGLADVIDAAVQQTGCDVNAKADDRYKTRWIHHRLPGRTLFPRNSDIYRSDLFFTGSDVTPLYVAARVNRVEAVKRLLAAGADINATKLTAGQTVGPGGVQVDGPTYSGITALHAAAARGHVDVVRILTAETNCRLNPATTDGTTPLHCAVEGRHLSVVRALLDARKEQYHQSGLIMKPSRAATMPEMAASRFDRRYANGKSVNGRTFLDDVIVDVDARKRCMSVDNVTALHLAATLDNDEIARELIAAGAVINARSSDGTTPLHMVAQGGSPLIAVLLIKSGADTEAMAAFDRCSRLTPLHLAARAGYSDVIDRLVNTGHANVGAVCCIYGVDDVTALHLAAVYGHAAACRKLVQLGADLNARTATGRTPLHLAVAERREEAVEVLVETDVESRSRSSSDATISRLSSSSSSSKTNTAAALDDLLHLAVAHSSARIIRALITTAGYDVNKKLPVSENGIGVTALCMAVESHVTSMVRLLLELGADPNADMNSLSRGVTALHAAAEQGSVDIAELLVAAGADVNSMADYGHLRQVTPIHLAVVNRHAEMVSFLSGAGADVNHAAVEVSDGKESRGSGGTTGGESQFSPLYLAVKNSDVATVRALLTARCNVSRSPRHDGWTPLHAACENGSADIVQELLAAGSDVTTSAAFNDSRGVLPLHQAAQEGHADIVEALVAAGSEINARKVWRDETGIAPLLLAAEAGHVKVVQRLIQLGADVNAAKSTGWTALHWAARNGSVDLAKMLLSAGAKVNCQASADRGGSPLDQAAERGHVDIIRLLISFGAGYRPDGVSAKMTALHRAAAFGQLAVVRLLTTDELCNAEMISALDRNGFTPLHYAAQNGHVDIVRTLIARHSPLVTSSLTSTRTAHNVTTTTSIKTTDVLPLHLAATAGHLTICRFLVAAGCPVDSRTDYFRPRGATALHLSVVGGHLATVSALIELGADVNAVTADGLSSVHLAAGCVESGNEGLDLLDRLLQAGASPDIGASLRPIHVAARFGSTAVVRRLIRAGCDVNARTTSGSRALLDITEGSVTCSGMTALHLAAFLGRIDVVRAIIKYTPRERTDLAVANGDGLTAHDFAVRLGRADIGKLLSSSSNDRRSMVAIDSQMRGKMRREL